MKNESHKAPQDQGEILFAVALLLKSIMTRTAYIFVRTWTHLGDPRRQLRSPWRFLQGHGLDQGADLRSTIRAVSSSMRELTTHVASKASSMPSPYSTRTAQGDLSSIICKPFLCPDGAA